MYELTARDENNARITAKQRHRISGRAKPFDDADEPAGPAAPRQPTPVDPFTNPWVHFAATTILPTVLGIWKENSADRRDREERREREENLRREREDRERREAQDREREQRRQDTQQNQQFMTALIQTSNSQSQTTMNAIGTLTNSLLTRANPQVAENSLLAMYKAGGDHALELAKKAVSAEQEKGGASDKSVEMLLAGAGMHFQTEAEKQATARAGYELEKLRVQAAMQGVPLPMPMPPPIVQTQPQRAPQQPQEGFFATQGQGVPNQ